MKDKHDKVKEKVFSLISFHLIWYYVQYIDIINDFSLFFMCAKVLKYYISL